MENELNIIKVNMAELKADIRYIKQSLDTNDKQHKEILDKIDAITEHASNRFAEKKDQTEIIKRFDGLSSMYVSREEFKPIRSVIYGMVGFILIAFLSAIIGLVITKI